MKEGASDPHWYAALEARMAEAGGQIMANRHAALARLVLAQQGADTAFPQADLALVAPEGEETDDLALALSQGRRRDMAAGRTLVGPHRTDLQAVYRAKAQPADQCSTGEQKALLISLILANARALAQDLGQPPVLLFDEVAAHLDAARRGALYDEICSLGAQAILTGTEPGLFDSLGARAQNLTVTEVGGESRILADD
jgi:DNA replication and repair protein RecF